jgi:predicted CXXCH cytochrome family protein
MRRRVVRALLILTALALFSSLAAPVAHAQNKFRLKPGADGKLCLDCHSDFREKLKSKYVHTPVKAGECAGCHNPHTSAHGKLLSESSSTVCLTCHDVLPAKATSTHKVVVEGKCVTCHDPHASNNKANLRKAGNDLCIGCHKGVGDAIAKVQFKHLPVSENCLSCHNPHASEKSTHLLSSAVPTLCVSCHKPDGPSFTRQHVNYPVGRTNCVSCHNPHGSNTAGLLFDTVHAPVASKRCGQCHNAATSAEPFATRRPGFELCRGCHSDMMNATFGKNHVHWPLVDKTGCLNCHRPHAAPQKKLLKVEERNLCGQCHTDTLQYQARLAEKAQQEKPTSKAQVEKGALTHAPIQDGNCSACHLPHASDGPRLMREASIVETCATCHDWLKHTTHPMGDKFRDMRNRNLSVDCLSCHRSHGTGYRYMITAATATDLCVQCHKQLRR